MRTVNFSDARGNLKAVLDRVVEDEDVTIITRRDSDDVVVMSLATWNSWQETEYLLANPANARQLLASLERLDAGRKLYREAAELDRGYSVHEPPRPEHRVRRSAAAGTPKARKPAKKKP